jgi:hypothetical protein
LSDGSRWQRTEPPPTGPSAPHTDLFDPFATAIGVFTAVGIPIFVIAGPTVLSAVIGVLVGLFAGILAGIWVDHRDGRVWRGPRL